MQKIVFVGIILIIGLFSLQYSISDIYITPAEKETKAKTFQEVRYVTEIVYVCPVDSIDTRQSEAIICEPLPL